MKKLFAAFVLMLVVDAAGFAGTDVTSAPAVAGDVG